MTGLERTYCNVASYTVRGVASYNSRGSGTPQQGLFRTLIFLTALIVTTARNRLDFEIWLEFVQVLLEAKTCTKTLTRLYIFRRLRPCLQQKLRLTILENIGKLI